MFFSTLKVQPNPTSEKSLFVCDEILVLSSLELTFVAIHGPQRLLRCVLFKCMQCNKYLGHQIVKVFFL
jgi:hypothetical protein